jgi:hypothetical protein
MDKQETSQDSYACGDLTRCKVETSDTDLCQVFCQLGQAVKITRKDGKEKK